MESNLEAVFDIIIYIARDPYRLTVSTQCVLTHSMLIPLSPVHTVK